mgnify:CR=1 FL=1
MGVVKLMCLGKVSYYVELRVMHLFFLMIRRPPKSTQSRSSAASDVYKRQAHADRGEATLG